MTRTATVAIINKDEREIAGTLDSLNAQVSSDAVATDVLVVDASEGRLDDLYARYPSVRVVPFERPVGVRVSIPYQRNVAVAEARGDTIVFIDAGCTPEAGWLDSLLGPITDGESVAAGRTVAVGTGINNYSERRAADGGSGRPYLTECPTINLAFRRDAYNQIGGFDETFEYGSDVDFSWRLIDAGYRIRYVETAVVVTEWGTWRRQLRRSFVYGKARARLYRKHTSRLCRLPSRDPVALVYPFFLLALPLALRWPWYLLLLAIPVWRNRHVGGARTVLDHLVYGAGVLVETGDWVARSPRRVP